MDLSGKGLDGGLRGRVGLPFQEETHSVRLTVTTQVLQKLLGYVLRKHIILLFYVNLVRKKWHAWNRASVGEALPITPKATDSILTPPQTSRKELVSWRWLRDSVAQRA